MALYLASAGAPSRAAWWVQDELAFGSESLTLNSAGFLYQSRRGLSAGLEHSVYSFDFLPESVHSFRGRLSLTTHGGERVWGLRPVLYPKRAGSRSQGGSLFTSFLMAADEDTATQAGLSLGAMRHETAFSRQDGSSSPRTLGQFFVEGQLLQSYFETFQMGLVGDFFLYDTGFDGVLATGSSFHAADVTGITGIRPITKFPRAALTIQFARRGEPGLETHFFFNFTRLHYVGDFGFAHSALAGLDFWLSEGWRLDVSHHLLREQGDVYRGTTGFLVRYVH